MQKQMKPTIEEIKQISVYDYLTSLGLPRGRRGKNIVFFKSPFARDSTPSLCVYLNTNSFYDWSQGFGGSIIELVKALHNCSTKEAIRMLSSSTLPRVTHLQLTDNQSVTEAQKPFEYTRYLECDEDNIALIRDYASSRCIYNGYVPGRFYTPNDDGTFLAYPSLMLLHRDAHGHIIGAKFRNVLDTGPRYMARGVMGFYYLEHLSDQHLGEPTLYVVEGELNAVSLWQYLKKVDYNSVVLSFGGVTSVPSHLPFKFETIKNRKLIIDYDNDHNEYQKRLKLYEHLQLTPITLHLKKGEDLNTLAIQNKFHLIHHLL